MLKRPVFELDLRQVAEVVGVAGLSATLTIAFIVYAGRTLGPTEYADFAAALSVIYFATVVFSPIGPAVSRLCARLTAQTADASVAALRGRMMRAVAGPLAAAAIAGAIASPYLARALRFRSVAPLALAFGVVVVYGLLSIDRGIVQGLLVFRTHNVNTLIESAGRCLLAVPLFAVWPGAGAGMLSYLAAMLIAEGVLAWRYVGRREGANADVDWSAIRRVVLPLVIVMFALAILQNSDMLVVKASFAGAQSGAWGAATALARAVGIVFVPLYVMMTPVLTAAHESGRTVFEPTLWFAALFFVLSAPAVAVFAVWSRPIVRALYGADYSGAAPLIAPLAGVSIVMYLALMLAQSLITLEDHRFLLPYFALAVAQIAVLWRFHADFRQVLGALYAIETVVLATTALFFVYAWKTQRSASC